MINILAVDDDEVILELIEFVFTTQNILVHKAKSFDEVKDSLNNTNFDLIFLDYSLPEITGIEILHYIREKFEINELAVIMLTSNKSVQEESLQNGANSFLTKPFTSLELKKQISEYIL